MGPGVGESVKIHYAMESMIKGAIYDKWTRVYVLLHRVRWLESSVGGNRYANSYRRGTLSRDRAFSITP